MMAEDCRATPFTASQNRGWFAPLSASAFVHLGLLGPAFWWIAMPTPQAPAAEPIMVELVSLAPASAEPVLAVSSPVEPSLAEPLPPPPEPPAAITQPYVPSLPEIQPAPRRKRDVPPRPAPVRAALSPSTVMAADVATAPPAAQPVSAAPPSQVVAVVEEPFVPPDGRAAYRDNPQPIYPQAARRRGMQGVAIVAALVREDGTVAEAAVSQGSGHAILDQAAVDAVRAWRFAPATRGGRPVSARIEIPIAFRLTEGDA